MDLGLTGKVALVTGSVLSAVRMIKAVVPGMREIAWGRIINIGTGMATTPQLVMADYAAAKAALVNASVSLAKALAGTGITVNTISPGLIGTEGVERVLRETAQAQDWGTDWEVIHTRWMSEVLRSDLSNGSARWRKSRILSLCGQSARRLYQRRQSARRRRIGALNKLSKKASKAFTHVRLSARTRDVIHRDTWRAGSHRPVGRGCTRQSLCHRRRGYRPTSGRKIPTGWNLHLEPTADIEAVSRIVKRIGRELLADQEIGSDFI